MKDFEILLQMISNDALVLLETEYDKPYVTLKERKESNSEVKIRHLPHDAIVIKADDCFKAPDSIFKGEHGECKRADYIIISEEKKCIVHIELKSTKEPEKVIKQQLKGAHCFMKYCQAIGREFWQEEDFLKDYKSRFVAFKHTGSIQKTSTRHFHKATDTGSPNDTPDKAKFISYRKWFYYNQL